MRALFVLLSVFTWTGVQAAQLPGDDKDFSCLDKAQAEQLVRDFNINVSSFGGLELCDSNVDTKKLLNDLVIVRDGEFDGSDSNLFIRNFVESQRYFSWLKQMTRGIRRGHDIPYATAYNRGGYFTMQDGWAKLSTLGRVGTLIHEARHTGGFYHVWCDQGPYQGGGVSGCDETLAEGGSHGVEMEYYSRVVLQGKNFHPVYRQMARLMNLGRANFVFNDKPMKSQKVLVGLTDQDALVLGAPAPISIPLPIQDTDEFALKRTSAGVTLYSEQSAYSLDLYSKTDPVAIVDEFSYFKLLLNGGMNDLIDLEELDVGIRRFLVALTRSGTLHTYEFSNGRWSNGVQAPEGVALVTTAPNGEEGLFLLDQNGSLLPVNPQNLRLDRPLNEKWPANAIGFVNWKNRLLMLNQAGQIIDVKLNTPFDGFAENHIRQMVGAPIYDAYDL